MRQVLCDRSHFHRCSSFGVSRFASRTTILSQIIASSSSQFLPFVVEYMSFNFLKCLDELCPCRTKACEQHRRVTKTRSHKTWTVSLDFECLKHLSKDEYMIIQSHEYNLRWSFLSNRLPLLTYRVRCASHSVRVEDDEQHLTFEPTPMRPSKLVI